MGSFSWITQDTNESILSGVPSIVYLMDNKGNKWEESDYEGYGEFGGIDYYSLLADMNGFKPCRDKGIDLAFSDEDEIKDNLLYPNLVRSPSWEWINREPKRCPNQGFSPSEMEERLLFLKNLILKFN